MTCKDCIHYELCEVQAFNGFNKNFEPEKDWKHCGVFKDKSKYIELPCNVGDTVYQLDIDTGYIDPLTVENMVIDEEEIILRTDNYDYVICHSSNITEKTPYNDCFLVFLTKSEAEQKLKELKENANS